LLGLLEDSRRHRSGKEDEALRMLFEAGHHTSARAHLNGSEVILYE